MPELSPEDFREAVERIAEAMRTRAVTLDLSDLHITPYMLDSLEARLRRLSWLIALNVSSNKLNEDGVGTLMAILRKMPGLTTLDVGYNSIGEPGARALAEHLKEVPGLTTLDVGGNSIGEPGARALAEHLKEVPGLTTLDVGGNSIGEPGARALAEHLKDVPGLTTLDVGNNKIGEPGARALAGHLKEVPGLTTLDVGGNSIGEPGARALAEHLKDASGLTTLYVDTSSIGDPGMRALAEHLMDVPKLLTLGVARNSIGETGALALAEHLKDVKGLTTLDLRDNSIGERGVRALAEHLKDVPGLTRLDVWHNSIGNLGGRALAEHLKDVPGLTTLDVGHNDLAELYEEFAAHPSLRELKVAGNPRLGLPYQPMHETDFKKLWEFWTKSRGATGDIVREVKVQFLGNGHNGKTCVWSRLFGLEPPHPHDPTQSFEFASLPLPDVEAPTGAHAPPTPTSGGIFNVWCFDYGGQSHLHGSHRFFIADQRNIWIVVVRSDHTTDQNRLAYWLGMVRHEHERAKRDHESMLNRLHDEGNREDAVLKVGSSERPPVVLVLETWSSAAGAGALGGLDAPALSQEFGLDVRVVPGFDSFDGKTWPVKVDALKAEICRAITDTPEVWRVRVPKSFIDLRTRVAEWVGLPDSTRVSSEGYWKTMLDGCEVEEGFRGLYLHIIRDLGAVLYVGDRESVVGDVRSKLRTAIYNPGWVKDPVYRVLWGDAKSGRDGFVDATTMHTLLAGADARTVQSRLAEKAQRDDVLALMEECGLVFKVSGTRGVDRWLVPDHLDAASDRERASWGDADTVEVGSFDFLPDYALLPLIGLWRSARIEDVATRRDQFAAWFPEGADTGPGVLSTNPGVQVLMIADAVSRTVTCSLRGGERDARVACVTTIKNELRHHLGLTGRWKISQRTSEQTPQEKGNDPALLGVLSHLRANSRKYGLPSALPDDLVAQVKSVCAESEVKLKQQQLAVYRAFNVAVLLPTIEKAGLTVLDKGRLARDRKHVVAIRNALLTELKVDHSFWDVFGVVLPTDDLDGENISTTYQRAFLKVFPPSKR